jgi:hypothetical protein
MVLQVEAAHAVISDLAEVESAIRSHDETIWIVDLPRGARSTVAGKSSDPGSGKGSDCLGSGSHEEREKKSDDETHRVRVHYIIRAEERIRESAIVSVFAVLNSHYMNGAVGFEAKEDSPVSDPEPVSPLRVIDQLLHIAGAFATKSGERLQDG